MPRMIYSPENSSGPMQIAGVGVIEPGPIDLTDAQAAAVAGNADFTSDAGQVAAPVIQAAKINQSPPGATQEG